MDETKSRLRLSATSPSSKPNVKNNKIVLDSSQHNSVSEDFNSSPFKAKYLFTNRSLSCRLKASARPNQIKTKSIEILNTTMKCIILVLVLIMHIPSLSAVEEVINVRYGYFPEARPTHVACARGFFDFADSGRTYSVSCYPQTSGGFASSRLDNSQLDLAQLGSTPMAQAIARGINIKAIYISHYMGDSQGIYVRKSEGDYEAIKTPFDLRGRTVGVPFGSTVHYQVLFLIDLFDLSGNVTLLNLSPDQIMEAWTSKKIDAGAAWGEAREFMMTHSATTLLTASDMANWGRPTFVAVAARRQFTEEHTNFVNHFVGIMANLNDSFNDSLGEKDPLNAARWNSQQGANSSYMPSLVDTLMKPYGTPGMPSQDAINKERRILDLYIQLTAQQQLECDYLGPAPGACLDPSLPQITLGDTAEFLLNQKVIATLGPLGDMGDDRNCQDPATFCGGDFVDGSFLLDSQQNCTDCFPVGVYDNATAGKSLLAEIDRFNLLNGNSPFALTEVGRGIQGDSLCEEGVIIADDSRTGQIGDGANGKRRHHWLKFPSSNIQELKRFFSIGRLGKSYSDNLNCTWEIRAVDCVDPEQDSCQRFVELSFVILKLWSGDFVRVYSDPLRQRCQAGSDSLVLEAKLSGFFLPPMLKAKGCLLVVFETDANSEKVYAGSNGDGFLANYDRNTLACGGPQDCNSSPCNVESGLCECGGMAFGASCSYDICLGTNKVFLQRGSSEVLASTPLAHPPWLRLARDEITIDPQSAYSNDLDCSFDISVPVGTVVKVEVYYDLEPTHDFLYLQSGTKSFGTTLSTYTTLSGASGSSEPKVFYVPTDSLGFASLRLTTDTRGRRQGFYATVKAFDMSVQEDTPCALLGYSGRGCEVPHCIARNTFQSTSNLEVHASHAVGRVVSQSPGMLIPSAAECEWAIPTKVAVEAEDFVSLRLIFNRPLDLEPKPRLVSGDQLTITTSNGTEGIIFFVEKCRVDTDCLLSWQTGRCEDGGCSVRDAVEAKVDSTDDIFLHLTTDRNDGGRMHSGLDFDTLLVQECPNEAGLEHCEHRNANGKCVSGFCICPGGVPCSCPCAGDSPGNLVAKIGLMLGVVIPLFLVLLGGFFIYRRRKIVASREQKHIIAQKEAELDSFRDSIAGMRVAVCEFVPCASSVETSGRALSKTSSLRVSTAKEPPKAVWCWQETDHVMSRHDDANIYGDPKDCWILYDSKCTTILEQAYQKAPSCKCHPLPGYLVDIGTMTQTKEATGFQRKVQRVVLKQSSNLTKDVDLSSAHFSDGLPQELSGEPQVVLIKNDVIQISKRRDDGWFFGTKVRLYTGLCDVK